MVSHSQIAEEISGIIKEARKPLDDCMSAVRAARCPVDKTSKISQSFASKLSNSLTNGKTIVRPP